MFLRLVGEDGPYVQDGHQSQIYHMTEPSRRNKKQDGGITKQQLDRQEAGRN